MSMRIAPAAGHSSTHSRVQASTLGAPSAPGLHDTLRAGVGPATHTASTTSSSSAPIIDSAHPLETRLANWSATQEALKMEGLRRTFGMAEPIRRGMEMKVVRDGEWRFSGLGGSERSISEEILSGRDTMCGWEDVFTGRETRREGNLGEEIERKVKMGV